MTDNQHIWVVIMAGGLGSRFWPVSGVDCPKQFIDVIGIGRSMLQLTFDRFEQLCPRDHIVIVTGEQYVDRVHEQVPDLKPWQVLGEPLRRNTAPCIAYAASVISRMDPGATIVVSPSDHAIFRQERYLADIRQAIDTVQEHHWIITLGIQPVRPDTSYGYIQFLEKPSTPEADNLHKVVTFTEKPPVELARQFIASGEFLWNAGILVWQLQVLRASYYEFMPQMSDAIFSLGLDTPHDTLNEVYSQCEAVSVDNAIMEKADYVHVLEASFGWSDVETWDSLYGVFRHDKQGNAVVKGDVLAYNTRNCVVVAPEDRTVVLEGLDGYIIAANEDTFMICRRQSEDKIFKFASDVELKRLMDKKN